MRKRGARASLPWVLFAVWIVACVAATLPLARCAETGLKKMRQNAPAHPARSLATDPVNDGAGGGEAREGSQVRNESAYRLEPDLFRLGNTGTDMTEAILFVALGTAAVFILSSSMAALAFTDSLSALAAAVSPADGGSGTSGSMLVPMAAVVGQTPGAGTRSAMAMSTSGHAANAGWGKAWFKRNKRWGK